MKKFNKIEFIKAIIQFGERQGVQESKVADLILKTLQENNVNYFVQEFKTKIPFTKNCELLVDEELIPCKSTSFISGIIQSKDNLVSSLIPSKYLINHSNINFNPQCNSISKSNYYFAPSIAICKKDLIKIIQAKEINARVDVDPVDHLSKNILVGNLNNPKNIYIAHYDSIETGAIDNASGVSVIMDIIINLRHSLKSTLFVFSGNEELSYDQPTYWGHGFRAFEAQFKKQLINSYKVLIIDCVGNGIANIIDEDNLKYLAFPIHDLDKIKEKVKIVAADMHNLMSVYHSCEDNINCVNEKYLNQAQEIILTE